MSLQSRDIYHRKYVKAEGKELDESTLSDMCEESFPYEIRKFKEDKEDSIINRLKDTVAELDTPYYWGLAMALMEHGTAGKVAKETGIPKSSVQVGIKKIRNYLKDE